MSLGEILTSWIGERSGAIQWLCHKSHMLLSMLGSESCRARGDPESVYQAFLGMSKLSPSNVIIKLLCGCSAIPAQNLLEIFDAYSWLLYFFLMPTLWTSKYFRRLLAFYHATPPPPGHK